MASRPDPPAMAGAPIVPRTRRAYAFTAPPNLTGHKATLKRDAPTIWELQTSMAASEQVEAHTIRRLPASPHTWGRAHSTAVASAVLAESEGNVGVDGDGESKGGGISSSWPRVRKQRTSVRNSMSLWEVSEALDSNVPQHLAVLPSPDTLDARALADLGDDLSFVDNMFFSHAPAPTPVLAPEDSMGMAKLGALMITPAAPADPSRAVDGGCRVWCWTAPPAERPLLSPRRPPPVCRRGRSEPHPLQPQDQRPGPLGAVAPAAVAATPARGRPAPTAARQHGPKGQTRPPWQCPSSAPCASSGRLAARLGSLIPPGREAGSLGAQPLPRGLELAASQMPWRPCGHPPLQRPAHLLGAAQAPPPPGWLALRCPLTFAGSAAFGPPGRAP